MKRTFVFLFTACSMLFVRAQTAVNFNVNDCSSNNHILFNELDAGKVVVITWVMPCGTCIGPALSAATQVQTFQSSNPGKIYHYIADDYANTTCATLTNWCSTNSIPYTAAFSHADIKMLDYGSNGMPKTIIVAGSTHSVYFNENNTLTVANFTTAMNAALAASNAIGIKENSTSAVKLSIAPNPANDHCIVRIESEEKCYLLDITGKTINEYAAINGEININSAQLSAGLYYLRTSSGKQTKLSVIH